MSETISLALDEFEVADDAEPISRENAVGLIFNRLRNSGMLDAEVNQLMREGLTGNTFGGTSNEMDRAAIMVRLAREIADQLPDEALVEDVLTTFDMRVPLANIRSVIDEEPDSLQRGDIAIAADVALVGLTGAIARDTEVALAEAGVPPERISEIVADVRQLHTEGVAHAVPDYSSGRVLTDPVTGQPTVVGNESLETAFDFEFDPDGASGGVSESRFLTPDELEEMFATTDNPLADLEDLRRFEAERQAEIDAGLTVDGDVARVQVTDRTPTLGEIPGFPEFNQRPNPTNGGAYTLNETLRLPMEMSESELRRLQTRMREAGIFDLVGGDPDLLGDPTDPRFKRAWRMVATMSLQTGDSMTKVIADRRALRLDALGTDAGAQAAANALLSDPARIRTSANTIAAAEIGRRLTPEEQTELVHFVHELERRNAAVAARRDQMETSPTAGDLETMAERDEQTRVGDTLERDFEESDAEIDAQRQEQSTETAAQTPDLDADLNDQIIVDIEARMRERIDSGVEAEGNDVADQYAAFSRILAGPGRG